MADPEGSKYSTQEWLEMIERAKEIAISRSLANSYSGESTYNELASSISSPGSTGAAGMGGDGTGGDGGQVSGSASSVGMSKDGRNTLKKEQGDTESIRSKKPRFGKRHSKSGLAAVF